MHWIYDYQLFLFDFDGLLVDTESIQFQAYKNMCARRGLDLNWSFPTYCHYAHSPDIKALPNALKTLFPSLQKENWSQLYEEKKELYDRLLSTEKITLMPGVEKLLEALEHAQICRCVVTNSTKRQTEVIQRKIPCLKTIPHWVTREDVALSKPHPDGYFRAISLYGKKESRIIGFEDSLRGVEALLKTPAKIVMISPLPKENFGTLPKEILFYGSFEEISENSLG